MLEHAPGGRGARRARSATSAGSGWVSAYLGALSLAHRAIRTRALEVGQRALAIAAEPSGTVALQVVASFYLG